MANPFMITLGVGSSAVDYTAVACNTFRFTGRDEGGDADCGWTQKNDSDPSANVPYGPPPTHTKIHLIDPVYGEFRTYRVAPWDMPQWDCMFTGDMQIKGEGMSAILSNQSSGEQVAPDTTHSGEIIFGTPLVPNLIQDPASPTKRLIVNPGGGDGFIDKPGFSSIAKSPHDAVEWAVTQLCGGQIELGDIAGTDPFPRFYASSAKAAVYALDVIQEMSAFFSGLATPFHYYVRAGKLDWGPVDPMGSPRYVVSLADGAKVGVSWDPKQVYNRVTVVYGRNQIARSDLNRDTPWGDEPHDMVANLGGSISDYPSAKQYADGLLALQLAQNAGWTYNIIIPPGCPVYDRFLGSIQVPNHMIYEGYAIQILEMHGEKLQSAPDHDAPFKHFITGVSYDMSKATMVASCGLTKLKESIALNRVMVLKSTSIRGAQDPVPLSFNGPESFRGTQTGPQSSVPSAGSVTGSVPPPGASGPGAPSTIATATQPTIPSTSEAVQTIMPQQLPPLPPPGTIPMPVPMIVGDTSPGPLIIPPYKIIGWEVYSNIPATFTIGIHSVPYEGEGELFQVHNDGGTVPGGTFGAKLVTLSDDATDPTLRTIKLDRDDALIGKVVVASADPALTWVTVGLRAERLHPGYVNVKHDPETGTAIYDDDTSSVPLGETLA